jgi:hypothetical protein
LAISNECWIKLLVKQPTIQLKNKMTETTSCLQEHVDELKSTFLMSTILWKENLTSDTHDINALIVGSSGLDGTTPSPQGSTTKTPNWAEGAIKRFEERSIP